MKNGNSGKGGGQFAHLTFAFLSARVEQSAKGDHS